MKFNKNNLESKLGRVLTDREFECIGIYLTDTSGWGEFLTKYGFFKPLPW